MLKFCNQRNRWGHNHEWKGFGGSHMEGGRSEPYLRHRHGGSGGGFGGSGEGKRRFFERGEFKFALLELLSEAPMHGYQLIKAMEEKTGGLYSPSPGSIYPNLQLLEEMELVVSSEEDGKKLYHITDKGGEYLQERRTRAVQEKDRWNWQGSHRAIEKRDVKKLIEDWPDVFTLMVKAARMARETPDSKQASQFKEIMINLHHSLHELAASDEEPNKVSDAPPDDDTKDKG